MVDKSGKSVDETKKPRRIYKNLNPTQQKLRRDKFLDAYAEFGGIGKAADIAGVTRGHTLEWREKDPEFASQFAEAEQKYLEKMELECDRRAMEGVDDIQLYQGEIVKDPATGEAIVRKRYSDSLIALRLKRLDPAYRETSDIHLTIGDTQELLKQARADLSELPPPPLLKALLGEGVADAPVIDVVSTIASEPVKLDKAGKEKPEVVG